MRQHAGGQAPRSASTGGDGYAVKPGDDFYAYANGSWMKTTEIPADRSSIGGFYIADHEREKRHAR